jgi:hypothetical protein
MKSNAEEIIMIDKSKSMNFVSPYNSNISTYNSTNNNLNNSNISTYNSTNNNLNNSNNLYNSNTST